MTIHQYQLKFKTSWLKSSLCDYSDTCEWNYRNFKYRYSNSPKQQKKYNN